MQLSKFKSMFVSMLIAMSVITTASAADIVIATGSEGMTYERWGHQLADIFGNGYNVTVENSAGSIENVQRCAGGNDMYESADLCFVQGDVMAMPEFKSLQRKYRIVQAVGEECLYIAYNVDGVVTSEDDLQTTHSGKRPSIVLGEADSGTAGTWSYITQLDTGYQEAQGIFDDSELALGDLEVRAVDAVAWMTSSTNLENPILQQVMANDKLEIMDFNDWSLNDELPNGDPVYEIKKIDVDRGFFNDTEVNIPCTQAYLLMNRSAPKALQKAVARTLRGTKIFD